MYGTFRILATRQDQIEEKKMTYTKRLAWAAASLLLALLSRLDIQWSLLRKRHIEKT